MTCPTCNDRGVTANRRLNRGNAMICPKCEAGQDEQFVDATLAWWPA